MRKRVRFYSPFYFITLQIWKFKNRWCYEGPPKIISAYKPFKSALSTLQVLRNLKCFFKSLPGLIYNPDLSKCSLVHVSKQSKEDYLKIYPPVRGCFFKCKWIQALSRLNNEMLQFWVAWNMPDRCCLKHSVDRWFSDGASGPRFYI